MTNNSIFTRKLFGRIVCISAIITLICCLIITGEAASVLYGDANGDRKVDGHDAIRLNQYLVNYDDEKGTSTVKINKAADVSKDGVIDRTDLDILLCDLSYHGGEGDETPVVKYGYYAIGDYIYHFADNGVMTKGAEHDGYTFDEKGHLVGVEGFITFSKNTYYIVNNKITKGYAVIGENIYYFGDNGIMTKNTKVNGFSFNRDGMLVANKKFVTVNDKTYYLVNNIIIKNYYIIQNYAYYFGTDGVMRKNTKEDGNTFDKDGRLIGTNIFITVENDRYFLIDNVIVKNTYVFADSIYFVDRNGKVLKNYTKDGNVFGSDGRIVGNNIFVEINQKVYYIVNNLLIKNYYVIDEHVYYFGDDGYMRFDVTIDGNYFNEQGMLEGSNIFITVDGGDVYYIINNVIVYNYYIIDNHFYYFGNDGVMIHDTEFEGNTYGSDGKLTGNNIFITINSNTYYIVNNVIIKNYYVINDYVYYFGDDGVMRKDMTVDGHIFDNNGRMYATNIFITVNSNIYYIVNNIIIRNYYYIGNAIYYFGNDGIMKKNVTVDGNVFGSDGKLVASNVYVTINNNVYYVSGSAAYEAIKLAGVVTESDDDDNYSNNTILSGVTCIASGGGKTVTVVTGSDGKFDFGYVPKANFSLKFTKSGYYDVNADYSVVSGANITVVMDKSVSNKLTGTVSVADTDTDYTNNRRLSGAAVTLERNTSTNIFKKAVLTDSNGTYLFDGLTAGVYTLKVEHKDYITVKQTVYVKHNQTNIQNLIIEAISANQVENGYASGSVIDARTGKTISGITVYIRSGINNIKGDAIATLTTNSNGVFATGALAPGNYTAQIKDNRNLTDEDQRYGTTTIALKVMSGITINNQNATVSNNAGLDVNSMRIVLTWGYSPSDLDSHLRARFTNGGGYHVWYSERQPTSAANLDVDDTTSYGPETVTINSFKNGIYSYYVHDFTNRGYTSNRALGNSGARVQVYFESSRTPMYDFYVPSGTGTYWHVFDYNETTGEFKVVNTIKNYEP